MIGPDGPRLPSPQPGPAGHARGAGHLRARRRRARRGLAVGQRPRDLSAHGHRQLPGRPVSPPARQAVPGAGDHADRGRHVHDARAAGRLGLHPRPPPSGRHGQDAHLDRRALAGAADRRRGRRLVEGGAGDPGRAIPPARAPGRRGAARVQGALDPGQSRLRRRVLPLPRRGVRAQARAEATPADLGGRRQRRRIPSRGHARRRLARDVQDARAVLRGARPAAQGGGRGAPAVGVDRAPAAVRPQRRSDRAGAPGHRRHAGPVQEAGARARRARVPPRRPRPDAGDPRPRHSRRPAGRRPRVSTLAPRLTELASGLRFPEGPMAMPDGSVILVEIERKTLSRVTRGGTVQVIASLGGGPNGAAMGPGGKIYVTNNGGFEWIERPGRLFPAVQAKNYTGGSIQIVDPETGKFDTLYDACDGRKLRGPNDLVFDRAGGFWFTDLGKTRERDSDRGAVYYAQGDGSSITEVIFPLERPNGIGLSPDERTLYVVETPTARCWAFKLSGPGQIESADGPYRGEKGRVVVGLGGYQMFDSLAVDAEGHIAVATLITGAVSDIWPDGSRVDQYTLPDMMVTNVCFGGRELRTAFATLSLGGTLVSFEWPRPGLALNYLNAMIR